MGSVLRGLRGDPFGRLEQLVPGAELHTWAPELLAGGALELVDRRPAGLQHRTRAARCERCLDRLGRRLVLVDQAALAGILEQKGYGLRRVLLVRADDPGGAALDPARAVDAGEGLALVADHAPAVVADRRAPLVEWELRQWDALVAHAAEGEAAVDRLALVGRDRYEAPVALFETVADEVDRLDAVLAVDRRRRHEEAEPDRRRLSRRVPLGELAEHLYVATRVRVRLERRLARRVELELGRIDGDVCACELPHLLELLRGPRRLGRPAAAEDQNLVLRRGADRLDRGVGRVGRRK